LKSFLPVASRIRDFNLSWRAKTWCILSIPWTDYAPLKKGKCLTRTPASFGGSRPQKSHPRFPEQATSAAFARAFARLEKDLRTSLGK
jgi:hypothetical protein